MRPQVLAVGGQRAGRGGLFRVEGTLPALGWRVELLKCHVGSVHTFLAARLAHSDAPVDALVDLSWQQFAVPFELLDGQPARLARAQRRRHALLRGELAHASFVGTRADLARSLLNRTDARRRAQVVLGREPLPREFDGLFDLLADALFGDAVLEHFCGNDVQWPG